MNFYNFTVHIKNGILCLFATFLLLLAGCEKDIVLDIEEFSHSNDNKILTIAQAKKWWDANNSINFRSEENDTILTALNVRPLWDGALFTKYLGSEDIILVPFSWQHPISMNERGKLMLVFFHGLETQQIHVRILGYYATENDYPRQLEGFDVSDFTGYFFQIDHCGKHSNFIKIQNGLVIKRYLADGDFNDLDFRGGGNGRCPSAAGGNSRKPPRRWISPGSVATNGDDSDGGDNTQSGGDIEGGGSIIGPNTSVYWSGFGNFGSNNFGGGGTAGTGSTLSQYFNNQIFNQTHDPAKVQLIEQFKTNQGINLPISLLMLIINAYCFDEPESFDDCALWSMVNWIDENIDLGERRTLIEGNPEMIESIIRLMLMADESGLSSEDAKYVVERWIDNDGGYVEIRPINYNTANDQERVEHIHKWLRYIQWFQRCNPTFCCPYYALRPVTSQDPPGPTVVSYFFNNFTQGGLGTTLNGTIRYLLPINTLVPIKIELTHWSQPRFQISPIGPIQISSIENNSKFAYPKYQSSGQAAATISLYFPTSEEPNFVKDFIDRPCR